MWKWVDPIIMLIIFTASVIHQIVHPLTYVVHQEEPVYPLWAIFGGAIIILSSVLMIPTVLIVRVIAYQSARDEGKEFLSRVYHSGKDAVFLTWIHIRLVCRSILCARYFVISTSLVTLTNIY